MYMKAAAEAAGITCRLLVGLEGLSFTPDGLMVRDPEGVVMEAVWKTWSWRTALAELSDDDVVFSCLEECKPRDTEAKPRLVDILLK
jgi:glutathionylspermidine synthase